MRIQELPSDERPRERMLKYGPRTLSNYELLAIILRNGTGKKSALSLAQELLSVDGRGFSYLAEASVGELMRIKGVGEAKACEIAAAMEIGKRLAAMPRSEKVMAGEPEEMAALCMEEMRHFRQEVMRLLLLNIKGEIIATQDIALGDLTGTIVHPREVFMSAYKRSAAGVVLVHNHPSGDPTPSAEDIKLTRRLVNAGKLLGVFVVDHLIIGDGVYLSFRERGIMPEPKKLAGLLEDEEEGDTGGATEEGGGTGGAKDAAEEIRKT